MENSNNSEKRKPLQGRYAYYRRCQRVLKNGEQCRCPAEKESRVCRNHRQQEETWVRQEMQRSALLIRVAQARGLASPMEVFGDFESIQAFLSAAAQEVVRGTTDQKVIGRVMAEVQTAIKMLKLSPPRTPAISTADQREPMRIKADPGTGERTARRRS